MSGAAPGGGDAEVRRRGTAMIWVGWALAIAVLYMLFNMLEERKRNPNTVSALSGQDGTVVLEANRNGMYHAGGYINGAQVEFILDTGATMVAVPRHVAEDAGLEEGAPVQISTANGVTLGRASRIDSLEIGGILVRDVSAVILEDSGDEVLLGMSALRDLDLRHSSGTLEIRAPF